MLFVRPILTQWNQNDTTFNFFYKYDEIDNEYILTENVVKDEQKCVLVLFDIKDVKYVSKVLGLSFDKYTIDEFLEGMNIESEHGSINEQTNVTNDSLIKTAKIVLAHLNEFPNYYNKEYGLKKFEEYLKIKMKK